MSKKRQHKKSKPASTPQVIKNATTAPRPTLSKEGPRPDARRFDERNATVEWSAGDIILNLYEVKGLLGEGGMGKVYRVYHKGWDVDLAVKSPRPDMLLGTGGKENFVREAETWVKLGLHPHTVSCYYVRELGGVPRVFAECVEGGSLSDWIRTGKLYEGGAQMAMERILNVAIQFAWGLHHAHEQGLVHQDVKPANLMLTPVGVAKVTDFGLAQARELAGGRAAEKSGPGQSVVVAGAGLMTPAYASPEQVAGQPLKPKTDIWSWGLSVVEMFMGELTWMSGPLAAEILEAYRENGTENDGIPQMPATIYDLLRHCFQQNPSDRPQDILHVANIIQNVYRETLGVSYSRQVPKAVKWSADSLNNRAASLLDLGKQEQAEELWEETLRLQPHHPEATYNRGLMRWRKGVITDQALIKEIEEMSKTHGDDWVDEYLLTLVQLERGDRESAQRLLTRVEKLYGMRKEVSEWAKEIRDVLSSNEGSQPYIEASFQSGTESTGRVALSKDGRYALRAIDRAVKLWDVEKGICLRTFEGHTKAVSSLCFSPDERHILSGSDDGMMKLWEVKSGTCVRTSQINHPDRRQDKNSPLAQLPPLAIFGSDRTSFSAEVKTVGFNSDGRLAVSGSIQVVFRKGLKEGVDGGGISRSTVIELWDVRTGECLNTYREREIVTSVCFSPDSRYLISGVTDGTMRLWAVDKRDYKAPPEWEHIGGDMDEITRRSAERARETNLAEQGCLLTFKGREGFLASVDTVCFSPDGRFALSGSSRTMKLWDVGTGKCLRTFEGYGESVCTICFSSDGRYAISGGSMSRLWDVETGRCLRTFDGYRGEVDSVFFRKGRLYILTRDGGGTLSLHRESKAEYVAPIALSRIIVSETVGERETAYEEKVSFAREALGNGDAVRAAQLLREARAQPGYERAPEAIRVWTELYRRLARTALRGAWEKFTFNHKAIVEARFSYYGQYVLTHGPEVKLWDNETGRCLYTVDEFAGPMIWGSETENGWRALVPSGNRLGLYEVETERCLRTFAGHTAQILSAEISEDGRRVITGSSDGTARLWDVETGHCLHIFEDHEGEVNSVSLSSDGRYAVSGGADKTVRLWESETGRCLQTFEVAHELVRVGFTRDCDRIIAASQFNVGQWDVATGEAVRTTSISHLGVPTAFSFSPDGKYFLFSTYDYQKGYLAKLCNTETGRLAHGFRIHFGMPQTMKEDETFKTTMPVGMAFSHDGQQILLGHRNSLEVRNVETGEKVEVSEGAEPARSYSGNHGISSVSFSRDGRSAFLASTVGRVELYELKDGQCTHETEFRGLTADGRYAITVDEAGTIRLWDAEKRIVWLAFFQEGAKGQVSRSCQRGRLKLSCDDDGTVQLQDVETGRRFRTFEGHIAAVRSVSMSNDSRYALTVGDATAKLWLLDWELEERPPADWDEGARPCLEAFLNQAGDARGEPLRAEEDFEDLMYRLGCEGYGWLRPEGVRRELEKMIEESAVSSNSGQQEKDEMLTGTIESLPTDESPDEPSSADLEEQFSSAQASFRQQIAAEVPSKRPWWKRFWKS
jgi:WD40 repeat protein/serine/threonine protein kinase